MRPPRSRHRRLPIAAKLALLPLLLVVIIMGGPAPVAADTVWDWPLDPVPVVLSGFAAPADPYGPGARGVALAAAVDQPVRAPASGTVGFAGLVAGRPVVTVDHGTIVTTYEPVTAVVRAGQAVGAGAEIGTVAALPRLCGIPTCLRWGAYVPGSAPRRYLDPLRLVGAGPVRLLPDEALPPIGRTPTAPTSGSQRAAAEPDRRPAAAVEGVPGRHPSGSGSAAGVPTSGARSAPRTLREPRTLRTPRTPRTRLSSSAAGPLASAARPHATANRIAAVALAVTVLSGAGLLAPVIFGRVGAGPAGRSPGRRRAQRRRG